MNTVRMILCGNVEDSRMNPSEKVGVVSVVFVSTEEEKIKNKLKKLQDKNPEKFYMEYVTPLDVDLTSLEHYPSIETSVYKGYKQDKIEMRGDRAEMSDFPLYLNTVAGGLDCRDQTIGGFSFVVKIYAVPVVEIIG